ncbi:hypothetical protein [Streptomyces sp. BE133]|uniref:hypothetical protein n=1 Tax=Streptomyces sp. BE133 TaxID=3002523 RepID=UPI002E777A02|nr:hypothetical protein [Streptomyces sp. BE133]MEE1808912.1 hypothetical protein [Streptomyces sp. BE133]
MQNGSAASTLALTMLNAGRYPVPVLGKVEVLHDPRIQLGDAVRVVDTTGAQLDTLAWVVGTRTTFTSGSVPQQTLTLRGTSYNGVPLDTGLNPDGARISSSGGAVASLMSANIRTGTTLTLAAADTRAAIVSGTNQSSASTQFQVSGLAAGAVCTATAAYKSATTANTATFVYRFLTVTPLT